MTSKPAWLNLPKFTSEQWKEASDKELQALLRDCSKFLIKHAMAVKPSDAVRQFGFNSRNGRVRYLAYRFISRFIREGHADIIRQIVEQDVKACKLVVGPRTPKFEDHPFHWGLLALVGKSKMFDRYNRRLFANELLYAFRRDVPPAYLLGFLHQISADPRPIHKKLSDDVREPWLP